MTEKDKISALLDGETVDQQIIDDLLDDESAAETWKSYNAISDVMRGETASWDIAGKVAAALEDEPVFSKDSPAQFERGTATVVQPMLEAQPEPKKARRSMPAWLQQIGQVATAACVSLAVIVGVQQYGDNATGPTIDGAQPPVLQTIPFAGSAEPVSLSRESLRSNPDEAQVMEQRRRINAMFQDYELQLRLNADSMSTDGSLAPLSEESVID